MYMTRAEKRRKERQQAKDPVMTYKKSELNHVILTEVKKFEDRYYHDATKLMLLTTVHALKKDFKFGKVRMTRFIDAITNIYNDINIDNSLLKKLEKEVLDFGIDIQFKGTK